MAEPSDRFVYFSFLVDGTVTFNEKNEYITEFILPRHQDTNDLDIYYLQSMLKYFDPTKDIFENEILDAFPVISLTKDKNNKFYKLSLYRLREFYKNEIEEDEYIRASMKHLFMYSLLGTPTNGNLKSLINGCLDKVNPVMYRRDQADTVDCESYDLQCLASYVPTSRYRIMKLLKGWIEGALHFYDYSIMFFDQKFVGFEDFNENIIDLRTEDLFPRSNNTYDDTKIEIYAIGPVILTGLELYYQMSLGIYDIKRDWLFTSPNNDNERDGKVMMFRNKDLQERFEAILVCLFPKGSFRVNEVFKWNRYNRGGKFNSHYDTMFVKRSSEECSLYTLLIYLEVRGASFMNFSTGHGLKIQLERDMAYIIPHWVKHEVEGNGPREFIKTEIVFKNVGTSYDKSLADAFDESCYYMLQSVRHPELKDVVSKNFNTINEARFYKTTFVPKLINNIFFEKTIHKLPFEYYHKVGGNLVKTCDIKLNFITNGTYYYFKIENNNVVTRNEAVTMLSVMQLDIQPKKLFKRQGRECECPHRCTDYFYTSDDFEVVEKISYWSTDECDSKIEAALQCIKFPSDADNVYRVGTIKLADTPADPETFYFAACQNIYDCHDFTEKLITEIMATDCDKNQPRLNVDFIGVQKNIVKIRQHSFRNGIVVNKKWCRK